MYTIETYKIDFNVNNTIVSNTMCNWIMRCLLVTSYGFQKMQVFCMYITGHLNAVFPAEYQKEILRYIYYHQVHIFGSLTSYRNDKIRASAKFLTYLFLLVQSFLYNNNF